jgi:hypothetical protein
MKTYPILSKDGSRTFAFEVDNIYIAPAAAAHLLAEIDGVTDVELRKMFSKSSDVHVEFNYLGQPYIVCEPYGDNSRYWVGRKEEVSDVRDITALEAAFKRYRPLPHRALLASWIASDVELHRLLESLSYINPGGGAELDK